MIIPEYVYTIDLLFFFGMLLVIIRGMRRGFYRELAGVLTLLALLYGVYFGYPSLMRFFALRVSALSPVILSILVFFILFFGAVVFYVLARIVCEQVLQAHVGVFTDRFSGMMMGCVRGVLLLIFLMGLLGQLPGGYLYGVVVDKSVAGRAVYEKLSFLSSAK